jgi:RNA polymerase sigma factor (sigma-70 family)
MIENYMFKSYLNFENLTKDTEIYLFNNMTDKNREKIINSHLKLVLKIAGKFKFLQENIYNDLVHDGVLGLLEAVEKFNLKYGYRFSTYAQYYIKGKIRVFLRKLTFEHYVPHNKAYKLIQIYKKIKNESNESEIINIISSDLGCDVEKANNVFLLIKTIIEPNILNEDLIDNKIIDYHPLDLEKIRCIVNKMNDTDKTIILLRYDNNMSWRNIGEKMGKSHEFARKRHNKIIKRLKGSGI